MRKKPYTQIGISRMRCFRCGERARFQWQICSDMNQYRAICEECDVLLNESVLKFMKFKDWRTKITAYRARL